MTAYAFALLPVPPRLATVYVERVGVNGTVHLTVEARHAFRFGSMTDAMLYQLEMGTALAAYTVVPLED